MNLPPVVSETEWQAARDALVAKEKRRHPCARRTGRRAPQASAPADREGLRLRRPGRQGHAARPVRGAQATPALPLHVRTEPGRGLPRVLDVRRPDRPPRPPARPRHVVRTRPRVPDREARRLRETHGLDDPLVLVVRERLQRRLRRRTGEPQEGVYQDGETFGLSVFLREGDDVFRTYFTTHAASKRSAACGRSSTSRRSAVRRTGRTRPTGYPQTKPYQWWRRHDEYENG